MLRFLIIIPFLTVLVVFFLINTEPYPMNFVMINWKSSIGIFAFILGLVSFGLGALTIFVSLIKQWQRARKAEQNVRSLEEQLNTLRGQYITLSQQNAPVSVASVSNNGKAVGDVESIIEPSAISGNNESKS